MCCSRTRPPGANQVSVKATPPAVWLVGFAKARAPVFVPVQADSTITTSAVRHLRLHASLASGNALQNDRATSSIAAVPFASGKPGNTTRASTAYAEPSLEGSRVFHAASSVRIVSASSSAWDGEGDPGGRPGTPRETAAESSYAAAARDSVEAFGGGKAPP